MKTVGQLIEELQKYDSDRPVLMASDDEGNSFDSWWSVTDGDLYTSDPPYEYVPDEDFTHLDNVIEPVVLWP